MNASTILSCLAILGWHAATCSTAAAWEGELEPGDVRRHGAVCDGRTDDTMALISAGQASLEVYLPASLTCRVSGPLAAGIRPGQRWYGGGAVRTDDGFNFTVFSVAGKRDVVFDHIAGQSGSLGVAFNIADARFIEFVSGSDRGRVLHTRIEGFQQAVRVHRSTDIRIEGNEIVSPLGWGLSIQAGAHRAAVVGNIISGTIGEHAVYVSGTAGQPVRATSIRRNCVSGSVLDGIKLTHSIDADVVGNVVTGNGGQGIYLTLGTVRSEIHRNVVESSGENGLMVFDPGDASDSNRLHHNSIRWNGRHGIRIASTQPGSVGNTSVSFNAVGDVSGRPVKSISVSEDSATARTRLLDNQVGGYPAGMSDVDLRNARSGSLQDRCGTGR